LKKVKFICFKNKNGMKNLEKGLGPPKILWENSQIFIETFGKLPPFISYHKVATASISEASKEITSGEVKVYTADGRYIGKSVPSRKGIYFVISGNKRRKVIVK
jgi:hypothetical protein